MMNPSEFANIADAEQDLWWYRGMRRIFDRLLDRYVPDGRVHQVLEAGCGTGYQSSLFARDRKWRMFPVDLAPEALLYARGFGLSRLTQCDIAALPFRTAAFDLVASLEVLVHFPEGDEVRPISELTRVLKKGGVLALRVAALPILRSRHSEFVMERQRYTRTRLVRAVEAHGIQVMRCTYANSLLLPVSLFKFRIWEPLLRRPPATGAGPAPGWLNRILLAVLSLEAWWIARGGNFPAGQSLLLIGVKLK